MSSPGLAAGKAVHHVAVVVADLAASERFYAGVLGLEVCKRWDDDQGRPRSVWVALPTGGFLALERSSAEGPVRIDAAPGLHCLALAIEPGSRERWRQHLGRSGVAIERESPYTLYMRDPDGVLVGLSHHPIEAQRGGP